MAKQRPHSKHLRERLPYGLRKAIRRLVVRTVRAGLPLLRDVLNIATTNGLDLGRELEPFGKREPEKPPDNVPDFLALLDYLTAGISGSPAGQLRGGDLNEAVPREHTRISIIICVYNHADYTLQCLRSLLPQLDFNDSEIIVVNNASTDETDRLLSHMARLVTVVTNKQNAGFLQAANQAAALARGQYLVFLNNDTQVHPGWLPNLRETVESDDSIGAVGSMLLDPDGSLQEAGGIVWRDGNAGNYGRGEDPESYKFGFAREVDYCSAAALLVRRDLFSRLGGFDEQYAPAYYEDTDLCFGIRSLGYKVIYQPLARVTHWEGTTGGTDVGKGAKRYQTINQKKFAEKWREVLQREHVSNQPASLDRTADRAADRRKGPRIVVFDNGVPTPDRDSGSQRMFMILKSLAKIGRPVFVPVNQPLIPEYHTLLGKHGIEVVPRLGYKRVVADGTCEVAILSRVAVADEMLSSIRRINQRVKIIFDTVDLHSLRLEREYEVSGDQSVAAEASLRRKQELRLVRASDQVWCVTENDQRVLQKREPRASIKVIPNIHTLQDRGAPFEDREGLLFIGSFQHRPNVDSLDYFVQHISPLVSAVLPGVKLYLAGSYTTDKIRAYASDSVVVLGHVPEVDELFHRSRLLIAPLRYGAGMKGKIGQAMSYGLPVITSSIGAEGFRLTDGHDVMIADEPAAFAEAIVKAYRSKELWQRLSDNGYRHVGNHLTPPIVTRKIIAALDEMNGPHF